MKLTTLKDFREMREKRELYSLYKQDIDFFLYCCLFGVLFIGLGYAFKSWFFLIEGLWFYFYNMIVAIVLERRNKKLFKILIKGFEETK